MTIVFDLEANGLLHDVTEIHCIVLHWCEENITESFNDEPYAKKTDRQELKFLPMASGYSITTALSWLEVADVIIGHNILGYDIPVIKKLFNWFNPSATIIDTLLLSRLYHPNLLEIDKKHNWKHMPLQLYGRHSLEAYGYRLGEYKGNFSKTTDWKKWSQDMQDYCKQDVVVTNKLCQHFHPYLDGSR